MKLTTVIEMMEVKQADMVKELKAVLMLHGDVDVYRGDMIPFNFDHLDELHDIDMVTDSGEPTKYPNGYLHLGSW